MSIKTALSHRALCPFSAEAENDGLSQSDIFGGAFAGKVSTKAPQVSAVVEALPKRETLEI